jgi:hypothetical protein
VVSPLLCVERIKLIQDIVIKTFKTHTFSDVDLKVITSFVLGVNYCSDDALVRMHKRACD